MTATPLFADLQLARRLERVEGLANAAFVEARARAVPESGACWTEIAQTLCMFDGANSFSTQTFGLGLREAATHEAMEAMEDFFLKREAPVLHEVSPLTDASTTILLNERGYHPLEFTTVLVRGLVGNFRPGELPELACPVRIAERHEMAHWAELSCRGWCQSPEIAEFFASIAATNAMRSDLVSFYAEVGGHLAATASLSIHEGVALLAGASTVPEARGQGAQQSLLAFRLQHAAQQGCTMAMMGALPGSASQRNAERNGLQVAYTRLKWRLES